MPSKRQAAQREIYGEIETFRHKSYEVNRGKPILSEYGESQVRSSQTVSVSKFDPISKRTCAVFCILTNPSNHGFALDYQGIAIRSRKKPPLGPSSARVASQTKVSTASSGERGAPAPPMSVLTHPGHMALTFTSP